MHEPVMISRKSFYCLLGGTFLAVVLTINFVHQVSAKDTAPEDAYGSLREFTDVIALVQKNYVSDVNVKGLVEGAIKGMLVTLDPHSSYLTQDSYRDLQVETKGEFGGLGIEITVKDGLLTVVAPIEDSPAFRAGVKSGDQIIKIGDEFTRELSIGDAVKKMRGPKGTPITISVHRENIKELIPLTVVRDVIRVKSVRSRELEQGFGYVRLAQFQEGSADEFVAAIQELAKKQKDRKLHGLVLDLRNNPGGLLTQAIRVSDIFLEDGLVVYTDGRLESQKQKYYAHKDGDEPKYPIIVIVNGGSASAAEIVAGALQDAKSALILGTQTFGKGSVQTILPMDDGAALRLTTALYYTRNGRSIQAQGITPDVIIQAERFQKDTEELLETEPVEPLKESDLPGAIPNPKNKEEKKHSSGAAPARGVKAPGTPPPSTSELMSMDLKELLKLDPQLNEALHLLKTWHVFKATPASETKAEVSAGV
ncbi:MAG: S41 family peptidase [Deltaproteobacteria bacterium]|nr:S41 family peptidase [Deltaproteobacteria bacterium]